MQEPHHLVRLPHTVFLENMDFDYVVEEEMLPFPLFKFSKLRFLIEKMCYTEGAQREKIRLVNI
jgi:hypothetical protein